MTHNPPRDNREGGISAFDFGLEFFPPRPPGAGPDFESYPTPHHTDFGFA